MTERQDWGRPQGYWQLWQGQQWQPPQYDPDAHLRRLQSQAPDPWRLAPDPQRGYPVQPSRGRQHQPRQQPYPRQQQAPWQPVRAVPAHRKPRWWRISAAWAGLVPWKSGRVTQVVV